MPEETNGHLEGEWAVDIGETGDKTILPIYFGGHCYYTRKCLGPTELEGIHLPETYNTITDCSRWNEVMGVGPSIGKRCSKSHAKRFDRPRWIGEPARVGDWLLTPKVSDGIYTSEYVGYEHFIEESICWAIWRYEDNELAQNPMYYEAPESIGTTHVHGGTPDKNWSRSNPD